MERCGVVTFLVSSPAMLFLPPQVYIYVASSSMAVLASLVDSAVDLAAQGMLMAANRVSSQNDQVTYPAGRSRLEPVGVVACALLMAMASAQVIRDAVRRSCPYTVTRYILPTYRVTLATYPLTHSTRSPAHPSYHRPTDRPADRPTNRSTDRQPPTDRPPTTDSRRPTDWPTYLNSYLNETHT